jgi:conjugative transposon protein traQ family protein
MAMNIKNIKNLRVKLMSMATVLFVGLMGFFLASCDDELDIQQSYPFTVETMPVPNKVTKGQTVEIRCEMKKEGNYANALYTIRYFQFEGEGTLKMDNGITFLPNDRYLLENEKFRLYYTSGCSEAQNFIVVVEDNFGNAYELEFDFNNQNVKDETLSVVPIGNFKPLS